MIKCWHFRFFFAVRIAIILVMSLSYTMPMLAASDPAEAPTKQLFFVENKNQWDSKILYMSELQGGKLYLEKNLFTYQFVNPADAQLAHSHDGTQLKSLRCHAFRVHFAGCNSDPVVTGSEAMSAYRNYFIGRDSARWASYVQQYKFVQYADIYPHTDLHVYSKYFSLKYDFVVNPGSDVSLIQLVYEGSDHLAIGKAGELQIGISTGDIIEQKPFAYQSIDGETKVVECKFYLSGNTVSFSFPQGYDKAYPLVIDPTLIFSSYTGSHVDNWGFTATYDQAGDFYSGGMARGTGYPVTVGAYQVNFRGGGYGGNGEENEIVISKFNPGGTNLLFSTYLGGSDNEQPNSLIVDKNDNLIVYGATYSSDFPVTNNAYSTSYSGNGDVIVSKFNTSGSSLLASTYIGGSDLDGLNISDDFYTQYSLKFSYADETRGDVEVDDNNNIIVASCTQSFDFPVTPGAAQTTFRGGLQDGMVFKLNSSMTSLIFSTYLGGSANDAVYSCSVSANNEIYVAGGTESYNFPVTAGALHTSFQGTIDGFVTHLDANGTTILNSTYIGTSNYDQVYFVQMDFNGNIYVCGQTMGAYPVSPGVYSNPGTGHFIHKMSADLKTSFFSTTFGSGSVPNLALTAFLVDTCENIYVAGWGRCINFGGVYPSANCKNLPITSNALQKTTDGCDFYFFCLSRDAASLLYATYFGGALSKEHVDGGTSRFDKRGTIYEAMCAGCWGHSDLPTTPTAWSRTNNTTLCNLAAVKINFDLSSTVSSLTASPLSGCVPFTAQFINNSLSATAFSWDFGDGSPPDNSYAPSHTYVNVGVYNVRLIASNSQSCNKTDTAYAIVTVAAPHTVTGSFSLIQAPACDSLYIGVTSTGGGQLLSWDFGDFNTATGKSVSHIYSDTGLYTVTLIAQDPVCSTPDTITQTVHFSAFDITAAVDLIPSGCRPLTTSFTNNSVNATSYIWTFGDGSPADNSFAPSHIYQDAGTYQVMLVAVNSSSCNVKDTAYTIVVVTPPDTVKGSFSVVQPKSCDSLYILVSSTGGGQLLSWDFGDNVTGTGANLYHTYRDTGIYIVRLVADDPFCSWPDTVTTKVQFKRVEVKSEIDTGTYKGCVPLNVNFINSSANAAGYTWNFGDGSPDNTAAAPTHIYTKPGTYRVMLIAANSQLCNRADTDYSYVIINAPDTVKPFFSLIQSHDCDSMYISVTSTGGGLTYSWDFGDKATTTGSKAAHTYRDTGIYVVMLTARDTGCTVPGVFARTIHFVDTLKVGIDTSGGSIGCRPLKVHLDNPFKNGSIYSWNFGDGSSSSAPIVDHVYKDTGSYTIRLMVIDSSACNIRDSGAFTIHVFEAVEAGFRIQEKEYYETDKEINIYDESKDAIKWLYDFGNGDTSLQPNPVFQYRYPGNYNICQTVQNKHGCKDVACRLLDVIVDDAIFIPNSFTPNGDGVNDYFRPFFVGILALNVKIFDRWGALIYEWNALDGHWDGTTGGKPAPQDVYVYKMISSGYLRKNVEKVGSVTLVR